MHRNTETRPDISNWLTPQRLPPLLAGPGARNRTHLSLYWVHTDMELNVKDMLHWVVRYCLASLYLLKAREAADRVDATAAQPQL